MTPEHSARIDAVYHAALKRASNERAAFLEEMCAGDEALRRAVESLLGAAEDAFLDEPALAPRMVNAADHTTLIGRRLGIYQLQSRLGAGAMGVVYRARDIKLGRDVAIKILSRAFTSDPERLVRFEREARILASLNHPNIGAIYGVEEAEGERALVLELVEGETLADRITRGPIVLTEALGIAHQIADALEAAHEKGVIHRDLKPANISLTRDGTVKVLDFGLAKAVKTVEGSSEVTIDSTREGTILGTVAYMSPEQARGQVVDKRSDIWAFGCVLFEMLTGRVAFRGATLTDTLAAIIEREPDWHRLPAAAPPTVRRLLGRCLAKDVKHRLRDIGDARLELDDAPGNLANRGTVGAWRRPLPWAATSALVVVVLLLWAPWRTVSPAAPLRLSAELGADVSLANTNLGAAAILSPDGRTLAFIARSSNGASQVYIRRLDQLRALALSGTDAAASPFFSPDGQWIAFFADGKLKKISVSGGIAAVLCDAPNGRGGTWSEDGTIIFTPDSGIVNLWRVSSAGGTPAPVTKLDQGEVQQKWPQVLPDGNAVLFTSHNSTSGFDEAQLVVQTLPAGERKVVQRGGYYGRYLLSGHLVYLAHGTLFAAPFDLNRLELTGPPVSVLAGVMANPGITGGAQFAASANGTLVYLTGPSLNTTVPVHWMDREGKTAHLRTAATNWGSPRFSPDGNHLAVDVFDGNQSHVWVLDWARDSVSRLTFGPTEYGTPVWTPDGRRIVFASDSVDTPHNLYWQRVDGTGEIQRLTDSKNDQLPGSWHPGGRFLALTENHPQTGLDVMILPVEGNDVSGWKLGNPTMFLNSLNMEQAPMFSPDGHWIAYVSNESGRNEVYVRPFPGLEGKWVVSTGGGDSPTWSARRQDLFFGTSDGHIMVASYGVEGRSFRSEKPQLWSGGRFMQRRSDRGPARQSNFDLHPDGDRFALAPLTQEQPGNQDKVVFIFNFFEELRRLAPGTKRTPL